MKQAIITIDGPSGVGKGTISLLVADKLGWHMLDSGALYRLTACAAIQDGIEPDEADKLEKTALELDIQFDTTTGSMRYLLRGEDVSEAIRQESVGDMASRIAALPAVRAALLQKQRSFATLSGLVADGRDMGTVVFPDAPLKIYLTASAEVRAERRYKQLKEKGISVNLADLVADLQARDERDANREVAPLKPADDAVIIDTTSLSIDEVEQQVLKLCSERFD